MKQFSIMACLVLFAGLTVSCASVGVAVVRTYTGRELPEKELGFVIVGKKTNIEIVKVDDLYVGNGKPRYRKYNPIDSMGWRSRIIEFLPGSHELSISFTVSDKYMEKQLFIKTLSTKRPITIMFTVEAGHIYHITINPDFISRKCDPQVEDVTDSKWAQKYIKRWVRKHKR